MLYVNGGKIETTIFMNLNDQTFHKYFICKTNKNYWYFIIQLICATQYSEINISLRSLLESDLWAK